MTLKLRHLEVFAALIDAGSISRAAERLSLTQPAVSVALANFEKSLGFRLFHRSKGYFAPTAEAERLYAEAERSLLALARFRGRAREIAAGEVGGLTIASNGASAINFLPHAIAAFRRDHPGVTVDLKVRSSRQVADWVASGQIDIGMIDAPVPVAGLETELFRLPCVCVLREDDPLAAERRLTPQHLAGRAIIGITGDHGVDREIDRAFAAQGLEVVRPVTASFFAIARNMVRAGAGVAIIDCMNGTQAMADGVTWRPFLPEIGYELAMLRPAERPLQPSVSVMLDLIRARIEAAEAACRAGEPDL